MYNENVNLNTEYNSVINKIENSNHKNAEIKIMNENKKVELNNLKNSQNEMKNNIEKYKIILQNLINKENNLNLIYNLNQI